MKGMNLQTIAEACKGRIYGDIGNRQEVKGVELDSRKLQEGYIFIATKGERVDGHSFIQQAFEKGCFGVVCERLPEDAAGPCILVEDSFKALQDIAAYYREQLTVKVVGVTGSVGKTSTKEVIASVLSQKYRVLKTEGNYNNEIGLPLTVLKIREEHEAAVLEMGINHFGEMHRLSRIAKPDVCVITNIGQCHLEFLIDRDGILRAKTEIFDFMNPEGTVCLNGDDDKLCTVDSVHGKKPIFFGKSELCDVAAKDIENLGLDGSKALVEEKIAGGLESYSIRLHIPGEHMVLNALAAISVGRSLDLSTEQLINGIAKACSVGGRSNIIRDDKLVVIDDCYNANPVSMKAAIELLDTAVTRKVAVLGDMFELGEEEKQLHYDVGRFLAEKSVDEVICVGALAKEIYDAIQCSVTEIAETEESVEKKAMECHWFETKKELIENIHQLIKCGDTVLIKASHGMGFIELVELCSSHTWL